MKINQMIALIVLKTKNVFNKNKKVVVLSNWFIPAKPLTDLYLPEWIQI